jgi:pyruvate/2-oxoglutarate dehydrogenase complex dihydrolipoamide dehydrogenase (E3) component
MRLFSSEEGEKSIRADTTRDSPFDLSVRPYILRLEQPDCLDHCLFMTIDKRSFDVVVVGGGSAGYAAARTCAAAKLSVAVIEGGSEVGGLCILRGCMPTKALLYATEVLHLARHAQTWGLLIPTADFDFAAVMARKNAMIANFADYRRQQLESGRFTFIRSRATFVDPHSVRLDDHSIVTARHFIISTGSTVSPPPWATLNDVGYWTSDDALKLAHPPRSLLVLGGGAVALELAQFFSRLDTEVTVIQRSSHVLKEFDADVASELEASLRNENIRLFTNTQVNDVRSSGSQKSVSFEQSGQRIEVAAEEILHALGRRPATAGLGLDRAGITLQNGRIETDSQMRTSAPHIYAAGDCTGPHEIVHIAVQQGEIAAHNIIHPDNPRTIDYRLLISVVFTDPTAASVGLTEKTARASGTPYLSASYPFNDHGKSMIMDARYGFVKLLADPESGEIIGGSVLGPSGGELIHEIVIAMSKRMTVAELAATPHYHPTLGEIWTYPAEELAERIARR